ncbi:MAG TPA: four helix bundle protein [Polyangiaceae bacterium]
MHTPLRHQLLQQILNVIAQARPLVDAIARRDRDLASQTRRALSSIALNCAEGFGSEAGNARLRFQTAHGSLSEAEVALQLAVAWGYVNEQQTTSVLSALHTLGGRLYGLSRR